MTMCRLSLIAESADCVLSVLMWRSRQHHEQCAPGSVMCGFGDFIIYVSSALTESSVNYVDFHNVMSRVIYRPTFFFWLCETHNAKHSM